LQISHTFLAEIKIVEPTVFRDQRGLFLESFHENKLASHGIMGPWVQDNHSSSHRGVLRGLHYQIEQTQGKLIRVVKGQIFDVAVDIRRGSATFGKWVGVELSADNFKMLWIPKGFAHGFLTLSETADVLYKATDYYAPQHERTILWDDSDVGVNWPLDGMTPELSPKDLNGVRLSRAELL
jgi:dTDP-4-dehydrorhamnose 3,5-epimerase